jgi:hypothetical protein
MRALIRCSLCMVLSSNAALASGANCALTRVSIDPIDSNRTDLFVGKGKTIEVQFRNESTRPVVDVFPEPPLTVSNQASGRSCEIDGGVWVRKSVFLSPDEKILVVQEFSGSNDHLVFYDTNTCEKRREIDVSTAQWKISNDRISIGHGCSGEDMQTCRSRRVFILDKLCKPKAVE